MPRYNLIMSNEVYVKLLKIAGQKGITIGKLINLVLKNYIDKELSGQGEGIEAGEEETTG